MQSEHVYAMFAAGALSIGALAGGNIWEWDDGGANIAWSTPANWVQNTTPPSNGTAAVRFEQGFISAVDMTWYINAIQFNAPSPIFVSGSELQIRGEGGLVLGASNFGTADATITSPVRLRGDQSWLSDPETLTIAGDLHTSLASFPFSSFDLQLLGGGTIVLNGVISGAGDITVAMNENGLEHTVVMAGSSSNTHTGVVRVNSGLLALEKSSPAVAVSGSNLIIGNSDGVAGDADPEVRLLNDNQIDTPTVTMYPGGLLNMLGATDAIDDLVMYGGTVFANAGEIQIQGDITLPADDDFISAQITTGEMTLASGSTIFLGSEQLGSHTLTITSDILSGRLNVVGHAFNDSTLRLANNNTYALGTTIDSATLQLINPESGSHTGTGNVSFIDARLSGAGEIAGEVVHSNSILSPGVSGAGTISMGPLLQNAGCTTIITIQSTAIGDFDVVDINGIASFAGELDIDLLGGFMPDAGDVFNIFDFTSVASEFDTITLPALNPGLAWDTSALYTVGVLSVVDNACVGDFDSNGAVGGSDLFVLLNDWGQSNSPADLNNDNIVNGSDLLILLNAWGPCR